MDNTHQPIKAEDDARVWAWMQAWDHLEAATKLQEKHQKHLDLAEPIINRLHRAAELYTQLAACAETVGTTAALILLGRKDREEQQRATMKNFMDRIEGGEF